MTNNSVSEQEDQSTGDRKGPNRWERMIYFFPVQLLFVHFKKNLVLLLFWLLLFAIVTQSLGTKYGVPYLFLQPEYLGAVNFLSHFIIGLTAGGFIMAFNISSYVVNGFRFPFLATLNRPFIKYCQNNTLIPLSFAVVYIIMLASFQLDEEQMPPLDVLLNVAGFIAGNLIFILLTVTYFAFTNKNTRSYRSSDNNVDDQKDYTHAVKDLFSNRKQWKEIGVNRKEWKVVTYISDWGKIAIARDSSHYDQATLTKVFAQNQINASVFQVTVMLILFALGWFYNNEWLMIPAAGSVLLFFTIFIMVTSAVYSWFKGWTSVILICFLLAVNYLSQREPFEYASQAYGLNYDTLETPYTQSKIRMFQEDDEAYKVDVTNGMRQLENWRNKLGEEKPIAVFINVPGGGLRSAVWTALSIAQANDASAGKLWEHSILISGSSGGMIGAAYLREFYLRQDSIGGSKNMLFEDLSADKLNPVAATAVMNDLFFRFKSFEYSGRRYTNDRAHAFERKLNQDTRGWLNRTLHDYAELEFQAKTPMMVLAPTISDDGRKLIISAQGTSYLAHNTAPYQINENIEFRRFFSVQDADRLSFLSALRMSATFPYVFPATNLPSDPSIEILDAGIRDNYGISNTLKFMYTFRHWLADNSSGVVLIQVRDQEKFIDLKPDKSRSLWESITQPFGTFYNTVLDVQDYQMEEQLRLAYEWYDGPVEMIELILERDEENPISLSWHLTEKEKKRIKNSVLSAHNQGVFKTLKAKFLDEADD